MKAFLRTVGVSLVLFIALSMLQEREVFSVNWFKPREAFRASDEERRAAAAAVYQFRALSAHWYGTGGDRRFEERLPASQPLIDELRSDVQYVARNGRVETPRLMRLEILSCDVSAADSAEVTTRELWVTAFEWTAGGESDEARSDLLFAKYRLRKDGARWIVAAWDPVAAPEEKP